MVKIALDAMGGDHAPREVVLGACLALAEYPIELFLVGQEDAIQKELDAITTIRYPKERLHIVDAPEVVEMGESPHLGYKRKKKSSIRVGLGLLKEKEVDAFVSAGNTGAVMMASTLLLGKIAGVERPAIATVLPSETGRVVMLDMGSNMDSRPNHLVQFAMMGHFFAKLVLGIETPRVGLLNVGEERDKGNHLTHSTFELLEKMPLTFIGNIESKEVFFGKADVVVCDGFVGNNLLKFGEGVAELFFGFFKREWKSSVFSKIGMFFLMPALKRFKHQFDYEEVGGAPLLGVNGVSIIAHGKSNGKAIKNAVRTAYQAVESRMIDKIAGAVK